MRKSRVKTQHSKNEDRGTRSYHFVANFIFLNSKITVNGDCGREIKRHLLLGRKAMTNLDSVLESRDITLLTNVHLVKDMVFPVVMYECELDQQEN